MLKNFRKIFGSSANPLPVTSIDAPWIQPQTPFVAIGDIHGQIELLDRLTALIDERCAADMPRVYLGDYIDRGMNAAKVLHRLRGLQEATPEKVVCILGNHEQMMLDFIDDPIGRGRRWLSFGGMETLASFGLKLPRKKPDEEEIYEVGEQFEDAIPQDLLTWLRGLPVVWHSGNIYAVHAGMDPDCGPDEQERKIMVWGHSQFLKTERDDRSVVLHGHTIMDKPVLTQSRISIDTGAYQTGHLTAAIIEAGRVTFVTT